MGTRFVCALLFTVLAGCGQQATKTEPVAGGQQSADSILATKIPAKTPYNGLTADLWAKQLHDANEGVSQKAAFALNQLRSEGLYYLLEGTNSKWDHVRYQSVRNLPYETAAKFKAPVLAQLKKLLKDPAGEVRGEAAVAILHCEFKEGLPALQEAFGVEKAPSIKSDIGRYIDELSKH